MTCPAGHAHRSGAPIKERTPVVANERVAEGIGLLTLEAPLIASTVQPGQFVHVRLSPEGAVLLRRPFSIHRAHGDRVEILYQVLGAGTRIIADLAEGDVVDCVGPLGHGWDVPSDCTHALLVAGGLGAAPMGMLAEKLARQGVAVSVAQGAPTQERLVGRHVFEQVARCVEVATDDGSAGRQGFVTVVCECLLAEHSFDVAYVCGPEAMQRAVAAQCAEASIPCQVSLERLMACGIGACLSCVVTTTDGLKRACVDGPVFDATSVVWDPSEIPPRH